MRNALHEALADALAFAIIVFLGFLLVVVVGL